ncbi:hypothetical protein SLA2020_337090 [Shorea laevis]
MAVDANFASLFEKLKVEDPWLPPRTWESIPSQSGPPPLRRPHHSISASSSVSEASLVRLALNAMHGVESALISIEKLSSAFCCDPADRTFHQIPSLWNRSSSTHALGKILRSIGCSGFSVLLLHDFVEYFMNLNLNLNRTSAGKQGENSEALEKQNHFGNEEHDQNSLVNQAFAVAVTKILEGYVHALDTIHASVGLRRSSKSMEVISCVPSGCLTSVVHSEFTLLEVYLHTKELMTQIEALASICKLNDIANCFAISSFEELIANATLTFRNFYRGADLLSYLYAQLKVADPAHSSLLKFLFLRWSEPYCGFIRSWIFKAEINDPHKEFVVEYVDKSQSYQSGKVGGSIDSPLASIRECDGAAVPCFLKDFLIPLVRAGQQLQVVMKLLELCKYITLGDNSYMDFLPCWSRFSGNHPIYATPITFSKGNIEDLVLRRNNYYERMQERLETLLAKLEFSHQEILSPGTEPMLFGNVGVDLNTTVSFTVEDKLLVTARFDQSRSHVVTGDNDFEDNITNNYFSPMVDMSESSECSSVSSFEEQAELTELIKYPNSLIRPQNKYFSALKFSSSTSIDDSLRKPLWSERSCHIESDSCEIYERIRWSCVPDRSWPLGSFLINPFYFRRNEIDTRLYSPDSSVKLSNGIANDCKDVLSCLCKSIASGDASKVGRSVEDQAENDPTSDLFRLQHWKLKYSSDILSKNPVLAKSSLHEPVDLCSIVSRQPSPFFDFSSVNDPCKICFEKLVAGFSHKLLGNSSSSLTSGKSNEQCIEGCGHSFLVGESKVSYAHSPQDLKKQNQEGTTLTTVSGGSSWESLLGSSSITYNCGVLDCQQTPPVMFETPLDFVIDKCLLQEISLQYNYVSKLTIKLLEEGFNLQEHLLALRRYHFMELADWADLFIMSLWHHKWWATEADRRVSEIQGLLELSIQRSSCEQDHKRDRLFVYMKGDGMVPLSTSTVGVHSFDFLGLGYRVDWPVNIILTPAALKIYANIFSFLIQLKLAIFSLTDVWCSLKDVMHLMSKKHHSAVHKHEIAKFNMLMKLRHQVNHFVSTLQQYVQSQLSHVSWCRFLHSFKHKVKDMMDLESVHMAYLSDSLQTCFLSKETRSIATILESIVQCALDFRSCLSGGVWDMRLDQGDLLDKLSRVNISQVLAIKQKFDKNLKELHLCYLKSPKHGEFGLSRFWGYLNYNDYYSDENEICHYIFSI